MARAATATSKADEAPELMASEQITYLPAEGDPPQVKWMGLVFHANVPKTITNEVLIEKAKGNKFFKVGTFDPARDAGPRADIGTNPKSSREYRAHVIAWLKRAESAEDLIQRWAGDANLRESCEAGWDDFQYLGTLIEPKLNELCKRDGINSARESELWARYGITEIPWRSGEHLARDGISGPR